MVAGAFGAGDGLRVQRPGSRGTDGGRVHFEADREQYVVAELAGPLDRFLPAQPRSLQVAGVVVGEGEHEAGEGEQPVVADSGGDFIRLLGEPLARGLVAVRGVDRGGV